MFRSVEHECPHYNVKHATANTFTVPALLPCGIHEHQSCAPIESSCDVCMIHFSGSREVCVRNLSTVAYSPLNFRGISFATAEHAYHASKHERDEFKDLFTARYTDCESKLVGNSVNYCGNDPRQANNTGGPKCAMN